MAVFLCGALIGGVAAPIAALTDESSRQVVEVQPRYRVEMVKHRYKAFSSGVFYVPEYDVTYRELRYNTDYHFTGTKVISYEPGSYGGYSGYVTQFECLYSVQ